MKTYINPAEKSWPELAKRPVADNASLTKTVSDILDTVRKKGDKQSFILFGANVCILETP